jgi:uncharacterized protein
VAKSSKSTISSGQYIEQTKQWLSAIVIGENFCPFAKPAFDSNVIRYKLVEINDISKLLLACFEEVRYLDQHSETETTLIILPKLHQFYDFLDAIDMLEAMLVQHQYEGVYQLAHFHPDYCFDGVDTDSAENYTNRSPYPMIHILREASLEKALSSFAFPENIPNRNIEHAHKKGPEFFKQKLSLIKKS